MPKFAARFILRVTECYTQKLLSINLAYARLEGYRTIAEFEEAWNELNHKRRYGFNTNPEVVVIKTEVVSTTGWEAVLI